jgi:hypothetical protein
MEEDPGPGYFERRCIRLDYLGPVPLLHRGKKRVLLRSASNMFG